MLPAESVAGAALPMRANPGTAPDPALFHPPGDLFAGDGRFLTVATSWSTNPKKGVEVYSHLDAHLDLSRFYMTFIGNTPTSFRNIRHVPPVGSRRGVPAPPPFHLRQPEWVGLSLRAADLADRGHAETKRVVAMLIPGGSR
jgi:hypothetical protein